MADSDEKQIKKSETMTVKGEVVSKASSSATVAEGCDSMDPILLKIVQHRLESNRNQAEELKEKRKRDHVTIVPLISNSTTSVSTAAMPPPPPPCDMITRQVSLPGAFPVQPTRVPNIMISRGESDQEEQEQVDDGLMSSSWGFHHLDCSNSSSSHDDDFLPTTAICRSATPSCCGSSDGGGRFVHQSSSEFLATSLPIAAEVVEDDVWCPYSDLEAEINRRVEEEIIKRSTSDPDLLSSSFITRRSRNDDDDDDDDEHDQEEKEEENLNNDNSSSSSSSSSNHHQQGGGATDELQSMFGANATWRSGAGGNGSNDDAGSVRSFRSTGSEELQRITRVLKRAGATTRNSIKGEDLQKLAKKLQQAINMKDGSFNSRMGDDSSGRRSWSLSHRASFSQPKWKLLFCLFGCSSTDSKRRKEQQQLQEEEEEARQYQFAR